MLNIKMKRDFFQVYTPPPSQKGKRTFLGIPGEVRMRLSLTLCCRQKKHGNASIDGPLY